jgi:predicted Zn finger-like uncharacterized protein
MDISCDQCSAAFKIPDEKIPEGRRFAVNCPKCQNKISVDPGQPAQNAGTTAKNAAEPLAEKNVIDEVAAGAYDADEKPFDFLEAGAKTALLCEPDPADRAQIKAVLENLQFHTIEAVTAKAALKQMRFHIFDVVILNEGFDAKSSAENQVLTYLTDLSMSIRRNIFVALITQHFRTMDNMAAFNHSVNLVVNHKNIADMQKILTAGLADHEASYRIFKESLVKVGIV